MTSAIKILHGILLQNPKLRNVSLAISKKIESFVEKNQKILFASFILFLLTTFLVKASLFLDPDFGWRLRHGQLILKNGFSYSDPFSYTMPSFPFVDHAWVISLLIGLTYPVFGKIFMAILATVTIFVAFYISVKTNNDDDLRIFSLQPVSRFWVYGHPLVLLGMAILLPYFSIRAQVFTWLMFVVLIYVLTVKNIYQKYKNLLPVFFLIWTNLHGGYALGLFVLYISTAIDFIQSYQEDRSKTANLLASSIPIAVLSSLAVLVNPYGWGSVREVYSSISDSGLRFKIAEWLPSLTYFDLSVALFLPVVLTVFYLQRKQINFKQKILFFILFAFALSSRRNFPFWVLYSIPIAAGQVKNIFENFSKNPLVKARFWVVYRYFMVLVISIAVLQTMFSVWRVFIPSDGNGFYPVKAVLVLKDNLPEGEIFSNYGWGGFLIWQLPEKRVFVDGRMPSWKYTPPNDYESKSAFEDYNLIKQGEIDFNDVAEKFNIDTVLWPNEKASLNGYLENLVENRFSNDKEKFEFTRYLHDSGWSLVYEDDEALIYKKTKVGRI